MNQRIPVIDCTDLYRPHQDVGDNFDLVLPYALNEEIDLRAIVLDCTERFRQARTDHPNPHYRDEHGPRDPGFVSVLQLNYIFVRDVPAGVGPFLPLRSPDDPATDAPAFQQQGVELILRTLREAIRAAIWSGMSGSIRTLLSDFCAAAYPLTFIRARPRRARLISRE